MHLGRSFSSYRYAYGDDRRPAEVRFDVALATGPTPSTHRACVRLVLTADPASFEAWERRLPEVLADVDCLLAGVLRYGATCEVVLQVEDTTAFARREAELLADAPGPAAVHRCDGWDYFTDRVCPQQDDWQRIGDREAVEALVARGLDPEDAHRVNHGFVGDAGALGRIEEELLAIGFEPVAADGRRLTMSYRQALRPEALSEVTVGLGQLCRRVGAVYDGWRLAR